MEDIDAIDAIVEFGLAETRFNRMRQDQIAFADHLISSWGHFAWPTGDAVRCRGNFHIPVVRRAIKVTLARRP